MGPPLPSCLAGGRTTSCHSGSASQVVWTEPCPPVLLKSHWNNLFALVPALPLILSKNSGGSAALSAGRSPSVDASPGPQRQHHPTFPHLSLPGVPPRRSRGNLATLCMDKALHSPEAKALAGPEETYCLSAVPWAKLWPEDTGPPWEERRLVTLCGPTWRMQATPSPTAEQAEVSPASPAQGTTLWK